MKRRVLVLGGEGTLGHTVMRVLTRCQTLDILSTFLNSRSGIHYDVEDGIDRLQSILAQYGPFDYLINCIGILSHMIDEQNARSIRRAILVNALFPHDVAALIQGTETRMIHISTDGVFSGKSTEPYLEDSLHDCADTYGKTKSLGEVRTHGCLTLRCSIIGLDPLGKKGLLEWFLAQPDGACVSGYIDHLWNGVTTQQFAELCRTIIVEDGFDKIWDESPIHHFCPNRPVSKYELLTIFKSVFHKDVMVSPTSGPFGPVNRCLSTKYQSLQSLVGSALGIEQATSELLEMQKDES